MIVLYLKENNQYIMKVDGFPELEERDNKLYFKNGGVVINDLGRASYREYPDQSCEIPVDDEGMPLPITLGQLNLRDFTAEELEDRQLLNMDVRREIKNIKDRLTAVEIKSIGRK